MKVFHLKLTDGGSDGGYAVILKKEASVWADDSEAGHEISSIAQSGNVVRSDAGLECRDGEGGSTLVLQGAGWDMVVGASGNADRQHDPGGNIEHDWSWEVDTVNG
ncbi:hypothetical protein FJ945_19645 [Mesorhizobium sp. B2-4-9]|uniref:hypothetical protein n=1 Tax=Mesorhizobium sp. B2-4-9 TaxID=2589940 RepID=UPI0011281804|nr:hypothetical protein [Mesorhizobium sp. B2-4-9]TPL20961.1 hypothetical protein FJ945_19645 [Mesorhizobium sp. B2-4-9]